MAFGTRLLFVLALVVGLQPAAAACEEREPTRATGPGPHDYSSTVPTDRLWRDGDAGQPLFLRARVLDTCGEPVVGASVRLLELHLADDLGGKGYLLFDGPVTDVEAAVEIGTAAVGEARGLHARVIAQLHTEMARELAADGRFASRVVE